MLAFLKLVPIQDYLFGALAVAGIIFWFHHDRVEQRVGEAKVVAAVQVATKKAEAAATAQIAAQDKQYATNLAKVSANYETQISAATAQHGADLQRLRQYDAYRQSHPDTVPGNSGTASASAGSGPGGSVRVGGAIENVSLQLADALRHDDAQLQQCWAERDSLTGK